MTEIEPEFRGLSLIGEEGRNTAINVAKIALGKMTVKEAGPGYGLGPHGELTLELDEESIRAVESILKPANET